MKKFVLLILLGSALAATSPDAVQRTVLGEMFTNWSNVECAAANQELDRFAPLHPNLAVIRYHTWWPGGNDPFYLENIGENDVRINYYQPGPKTVPRFFVDGEIDGGGDYWIWEGIVASREPSPSPLAIAVDGTYDPGTRSGSCFVEIQVREILGMVEPTLHFVLTESNILLSAPNGQTVFHQVMRDMLPDAYGEPIILSDPSQKLERNREFVLGPSWSAASCEVIVFVQDELTRAVLQAGRWKISGATHDVGPELISDPPDRVSPGQSHFPSAWIHNFGDYTEVFHVWCEITPGAYTSSLEMMLNPGATAYASFAEWLVPPQDSITYTMCVYTALERDMNLSNDTLCKQILSANPSSHDVGTSSILSPPDTVIADSAYTPAAWVHNHGDFPELFSVECIVSPGGYVDTFDVVSLAPGGDELCTFTPWVVPSGSTSYTVCVQTLLPGDMDPSNDSLCSQVYAAEPGVSDVGVESISSPSDTVTPNSLHSPSAWIRNYGSYSEGFGVECVIEPSGYADTVVVSDLSPGNLVECTFADWTVPAADSALYNVTVTCLLPGDANPSNDTMSKYVFALYGGLHDVGLCGISVPPDTVEVGVTYDPSVCVENLGSSNETFWTFCSIHEAGNPLYLDSTRTNNLHPGQQRQVGFGGWTVPFSPGAVYDVCAWVRPSLDQNPLNDSLCKAIYSIVGVQEAAHLRGRLRSELRQNVPNPFRRSTIIAFEIAEPGMLSILVFDAAGSIVRVLLNRRVESGAYQVIWDGRDQNRLPLPEGVYFCKLTGPNTQVTSKLVLIR